MNFLKEKKNLIIGISIAVLICVLIGIILLLNFNKTAIEVSSSNSASNNIEKDNTLTVFLENTSDNTDEEEIPEIVTDEKASDKELKEEKVNKKEEQKSTSPYYIKVNYKANVVTIYTKDEKGKYTVPYKAMVCSCGTYTPKSGTYKISSKYRWGKLIHDVYGQYATRIVGSILFHSVPYSSNKNDTLLYNQYDKLGTTASAGCVRLTVKDAKWIYDNCPRGTMVEFYSNSDPGPLGKPSAQKIASIEECRNWDPTDPAAENPWHTYEPESDDKEPTTDVPSTDIPNTDEPNIDTPSTNTPSTDVPNTDAPSIDNPSTEEPDTNTPSTDTPSTEEPSTDTPSTDAPSTDTPSTDIPSTEEPGTDNPSTDAPSTEEPDTNTPSTDAPSTEKPGTDNPSTDIPSTEEPGTDEPTKDTPSVNDGSSEQPVVDNTL